MRPNRFVTFCTGYVGILVRGQQLEKLVNLIIGAGLALWDIRRLGSEVFQAKMRAPAYLAIRPLIRCSGAVVKIRRKRGWPFLRRRLAERKAFWIGAACCVAFLFYLSSFILVIKVEGFKGKEKEELIASLNRAGLRVGLPRKNLWTVKEQIEQEVLLRNPKAAWMEISLHGVVAEVKVVSRKMAPAARRRGDLVATREGVVTRIVTIRGTPLVKEGDTVEIGERGLDGSRSSAPGFRRGRIVKVYPEIADGRVVADVDVEGLGDYFVNERTLVWIPVGRRKVIAVPRTAVSTRHGIDYVRVVTDHGARDVAIVLGETLPGATGSGARVEVLTGLRDGDRIVLP